MTAPLAQRSDTIKRREAFVQAYLACNFNGAEAAIKAGFSKRRARQAAHEMLKEPAVQAAIAEAMAERSERTKIDADWVLQRLAEEAEADLADLYWPDGGLKPVHEWPVIWRKGLVAGVDVETLRADGETVGKITKVKLSDRTKRIELLGKHVDVRAFQERVEHSGGIDIYEGMTPEQKRERALALAKELGLAGVARRD